MQRHVRLCEERQKESKRSREQFLKNPYGVTKKLFVEPKFGSLSCTKDELDTLKETYGDPHPNHPLTPVNRLKHLLERDTEFRNRDIKEK